MTKDEIELGDIELAAVLKDKLGLDDALQLRTFLLDKNDSRRVAKVGWCNYADNTELNCVYSFTLPNVFLVATDGEPVKVAEVVSLVSDYHKHVKQISFGEICLIDNQYLKEYQYVGCFVTPISISQYYQDLNGIRTIGGQEVRFYALFFVSEADCEYKNRFGANKFIDMLMEQGRNIHRLRN